MNLVEETLQFNKGFYLTKGDLDFMHGIPKNYYYGENLQVDPAGELRACMGVTPGPDPELPTDFCDTYFSWGDYKYVVCSGYLYYKSGSATSWTNTYRPCFNMKTVVPFESYVVIGSVNRMVYGDMSSWSVHPCMYSGTVATDENRLFLAPFGDHKLFYSERGNLLAGFNMTGGGEYVFLHDPGYSYYYVLKNDGRLIVFCKTRYDSLDIWYKVATRSSELLIDYNQFTQGARISGFYGLVGNPICIMGGKVFIITTHGLASFDGDGFREYSIPFSTMEDPGYNIIGGYLCPLESHRKIFLSPMFSTTNYPNYSYCYDFETNTWSKWTGFFPLFSGMTGIGKYNPKDTVTLYGKRYIYYISEQNPTLETPKLYTPDIDFGYRHHMKYLREIYFHGLAPSKVIVYGKLKDDSQWDVLYSKINNMRNTLSIDCAKPFRYCKLYCEWESAKSLSRQRMLRTINLKADVRRPFPNE